MLTKSKGHKKPAKSDAKPRWQFSPSIEEKRLFQIREPENQKPKPEILRRIPLLERWLERGKE
jgi:hypothetical protein